MVVTGSASTFLSVEAMTRIAEVQKLSDLRSDNVEIWGTKMNVRINNDHNLNVIGSDWLRKARINLNFDYDAQEPDVETIKMFKK